MTRCLTLQQCLAHKPTKIVGIAADHAGHELKEYLSMMLREAGAEVVDFGDLQPVPGDDYPDFVVPLARAVAAGQVERGVAICGSGVGACIVANKVSGVRACLIHDSFSAHQGVEDDDLNMICLGGLVVGHALAWELVRTFLIARFSGEARHRRRVGKVTALERGSVSEVISDPNTSSKAPADAVAGHSQILKLYLMRHGETEWSLSGEYTGRTDIPLTALGEEEARKVGQRLRHLVFDHVLTSPLQRARQTCALAEIGPDPEIDPNLTEWDNGDDEGHTPAEILATRPHWNLFRDGSPNGESPDQIAERADHFITRVSTLTGNVAVFSHGHFCRVLAARWIGLTVAQAEPFLLNTGSVSILSYAHDSVDQPAIELWNSVESSGFDPAPVQREANQEQAIQRWENEGGELPQATQTGRISS